jgi:hypothetical protein
MPVIASSAPELQNFSSGTMADYIHLVRSLYLTRHKIPHILTGAFDHDIMTAKQILIFLKPLIGM